MVNLPALVAAADLVVRAALDQTQRVDETPRVLGIGERVGIAAIESNRVLADVAPELWVVIAETVVV